MRNLFLVRHGETASSLSGQHTGRTATPLTPHGALQAKALGPFLKKTSFNAVFSSPLKRAFQTCEEAGFASQAIQDKDLEEWNYGSYENLTLEQIQQTNPSWDIFSTGAPEGETPHDVIVRAENFLKKLEKIPGNILLFSHGHFLKAFAAVFLKQPLHFASHLTLATSSLSILGFEHKNPSIILWNLTLP